MARAGSRDDPVTAYARSVSEGALPANRLVRLACERHLDDLATAAPGAACASILAAARHAIDFFALPARHSKGEWAGETFVLAPWQAFIVGSLFGWRARRRAAALPHRLLRRAEEERQVDHLRRHRPLPAGRRRRAGRRGLLGRHHPRPGADRVRRGQAHGRHLARAQAPGRAPDQQPARRRQRLALHAAVLRQQHDGRPERARRDHRRAPCPQDARRGRRARHRDRRQAPAAAVRDHHRRLRPPQHLLRAPRLLEQGAGGRAAGRQLVRLHRGRRRGRRLDRPRGVAQGQPELRASRSRRTTSRARPRRRSPCRAPRTPSAACTSTSGPSRPSAGSTWPPGTPAAGSPISSSCAAGLLRRARPLDHDRRHRARLGVPAR